MKTLLTLLMGVCLALASAQLYPQKPGLLEAMALRLGDNNFRNTFRTNPQQNDLIKEIVSSHGEKQRALSLEMSTAKPESFGAIQAKIEALESSTAKEILAALSAAQRQRLWEIAIQSEGAFALRNGDVAKKVGITPDHKVKIEGIARRTAGQSDELNAKMAPEIEAATTEQKRTAIVKAYEPKLTAIEKKGEAEVLALLSKAQLEKWRKAKGSPFKF